MTVVSSSADTVSLGAARSTRRGDSVFKHLTLLAGLFVLVLLGAIAVFLVIKALPAFHDDKASFWTTKTWVSPDTTKVFGIAALLFGTVLSSVIALVMAVPVAIGVALYIAEYAPRRISTWLGY